MKITLCSHVFAPSIGGIETMSLLLAQAFVQRGHAVRVLTQTPSGPEPDAYDFPVIRTPTIRQLLGTLQWGDVCYQNNISLQTAWPLLLGLVRRPWIVTHATWLHPFGTSESHSSRFKRWALRRASASIAISRAIEEHIALPCYRISNAYEDAVFFEMPQMVRDRDLCFLGRLVSDKGTDILLDALALLKGRGLTPSVSIIGEGEEKEALNRQATTLGLDRQVWFLGARQGRELTELLNQHQILVAPARWPEPFGLVALEGIACGCVVVGTEAGGLPDAIGPCGITVPNGDPEGLAEALRMLLTDMSRMRQYREKAPAHLQAHKKQTVADQYLNVFTTSSKALLNEAVGGSRS